MEIEEANTNIVVFVVGLYKSGTSLIAQLVERLGFSNLDDLWDDYVEGVSNSYLTNESQAVNQQNDKIIRFYFGKLHNLPSKNIYTILNKLLLITKLFNSKITKIVKSQPEQRLVIKDPRFCLTLPLWLSSVGKYSSVKIIWVIRDRSKVVRSMMKDDWIRSTLHLKTEADAFKLAAQYESYLLKQYVDYSSMYNGISVNIESFRYEPASNVKLLANYLNCNVNAEEVSKMIKK